MDSLYSGIYLQKQKIPRMVYIDKCQAITRTIIVLFYRHEKRDCNCFIERINRKTKRDLIHFTRMNGIDEKTITDTHKSHIHQSTSSDGGSSKLCAYPSQRSHKSWSFTGDQTLSSRNK